MNVSIVGGTWMVYKESALLDIPSNTYIGYKIKMWCVFEDYWQVPTGTDAWHSKRHTAHLCNIDHWFWVLHRRHIIEKDVYLCHRSFLGNTVHLLYKSIPVLHKSYICQSVKKIKRRLEKRDAQNPHNILFTHSTLSFNE